MGAVIATLHYALRGGGQAERAHLAADRTPGHDQTSSRVHTCRNNRTECTASPTAHDHSSSAGTRQDQVRSRCSAAKMGTDKGISHIAQALIHKYVTDLQQLGSRHPARRAAGPPSVIPGTAGCGITVAVG